MIICYARCWPCTAGQHYDPPQWHTWADDQDIAHATGQADPRQSRCGCDCANPTTGEDTTDA